MDRRRFFAFLPAIPVAGAAALVAAPQKPTQVRLPQVGEFDWGATINKAIRDLEAEINKLKGVA